MYESYSMTVHFTKENQFIINSILSLTEKKLFVHRIFANHIVNELIRRDQIVPTLTGA